MSSDLDIQRTIECGQRNLEAKELIHNWCGYARVEKFGGTGLIEIETGLPIGHHSMVCDHAPMGGMATWLLEESAIHFYDKNCVSCSMRQPIRLPNITKLIARRDADIERARSRDEELQKQQKDAFDSRSSARARLRSTSSVAVTTFLDDLQSFDAGRDDATAQKLIKSVQLAPELLTPEVAEHLFTLLENGEHWFDEVGLTTLAVPNLNPVRLARCAMRCLTDGRALDLASAIAVQNASHVGADDVPGAVQSLAFLAFPPRNHFEDLAPANPLPLRRIFEHFPKQTTLGIEDLLSDRHPFHVKMGARAVVALAPEYPDLPVSLCRSLATRLTRADSLIDVDRDSELREVVHELTDALVCAFVSDPVRTDIELMRYFEGAPKDGESRLSGIYEQIIRRASGRYRHDDEIAHLNVYRTALRRLVTLAGTSDNENVIQDILEALRSDPGRLAPLAREHIDTLLGAAALVDSKLEVSERSSTLITSKDPWADIEEESRRRRLWSLRASFVRWAIHGAAVDSNGLAVFTDFLSRSNALSEGLRSTIVEQLAPLMETGARLSDVLPFLYSAMVGESNLVRAAAATAVKEIGSRRLAELPGLIGEAFLLMLSDPYVIVHKSAVRALREVSPPSEIRDQVAIALGRLIVAYRGDKDQEFLLTCMEAYASEKYSGEQFKAKLGKVFIAILHEVKRTLLVRQEHQWLMKRLSGVDGYAELVLDLFIHCESDYDTERVLDRVRDIPNNTIGQHITAVRNAVAYAPSDPMVVGTFLEILTRDGEWDCAFEVAQAHLNSIPDTTRMRTRRLLAVQQRCRVEFEMLIAQGRIEDALSIGKAWGAASAEINQVYKQNEKTDPFRSFLQSH